MSNKISEYSNHGACRLVNKATVANNFAEVESDAGTLSLNRSKLNLAQNENLMTQLIMSILALVGSVTFARREYGHFLNLQNNVLLTQCIAQMRIQKNTLESFFVYIELFT